MRRIIALVLALLLLGGCAASVEPWTDHNLQLVQKLSYPAADVDLPEEMNMIRHIQDKKSDSGEYERREYDLMDIEDCSVILEQLQKRLGHMIAPVAEIGTYYQTRRELLPVEDYENAEFYTFQMVIRGYFPFEINFLIDGKNTPQACVLFTEYGCSWYTFDDPEAMIKEFWNDELAVQY